MQLKILADREFVSQTVSLPRDQELVPSALSNRSWRNELRPSDALVRTKLDVLRWPLGCEMLRHLVVFHLFESGRQKRVVGGKKQLLLYPGARCATPPPGAGANFEPARALRKSILRKAMPANKWEFGPLTSTLPPKRAHDLPQPGRRLRGRRTERWGDSHQLGVNSHVKQFSKHCVGIVGQRAVGIVVWAGIGSLSIDDLTLRALQPDSEPTSG